MAGLAGRLVIMADKAGIPGRVAACLGVRIRGCMAICPVWRLVGIPGRVVADGVVRRGGRDLDLGGGRGGRCEAVVSPCATVSVSG